MQGIADANPDDVVDVSDIVTAIANWQATGEDALWPNGDMTVDGLVDLTDILESIAHWQATPGGPSRAGQRAVPEPSAVLLLAVGLVVLRRQ